MLRRVCGLQRRAAQALPAPMPAPLESTCAPSWMHALGIVRPRPGWVAWLADGHFVAALLAALPVWLLLGALAGEHMAAADGARAWVALLLTSPIVEELVFRGLLQTALHRLLAARRVGPVSVANLLTSGGFVLAHLPMQPVGWALAVGVPALVFGHLRERHDSVLPCIVLHAVYNAGFGVVAWWVQL